MLAATAVAAAALQSTAKCLIAAWQHDFEGGSVSCVSCLSWCASMRHKNSEGFSSRGSCLVLSHAINGNTIPLHIFMRVQITQSNGCVFLTRSLGLSRAGRWSRPAEDSSTHDMGLPVSVRYPRTAGASRQTVPPGIPKPRKSITLARTAFGLAKRKGFFCACTIRPRDVVARDRLATLQAAPL